MILQSSLLKLEQTNTDVWEMLMIELVKARKRRVLNHIKGLWYELRYIKADMCFQYNDTIKNINKFNDARIIIWHLNGKYKSMSIIDSIFKTQIYIYGFKTINYGLFDEFNRIRNITTSLSFELYIDVIYRIIMNLHIYNNFNHILFNNNSSITAINFKVNIFKFMCEQEEKYNECVYSHIEDKIIFHNQKLF